MKKIITFCIMAIFSLWASAQTVEEQKKQINSVKKSSAYIYAEATLESAQAAYDLALELLYQRVNEYIAQKKKFKEAKEAVVINQSYATEKIQLPRGNMYRAFLYVKKSDIIPADNAVVGKAQPAQNNAVKSSYETIQDDGSSAVINEILGFQTFNVMKERLSVMKQEGKVVSYAMYDELASPENFLLVIFDKQGTVKAVLSEGKSRTNLKTKTADSIQNYRGMGAVGVKIK